LRKTPQKIAATRAALFLLKYAPNRLSAGASPQTPLGELTALPRPIAVFKGPTSKGEEGRGGRDRAEEGTEGRGRGERVGKEKGRRGNARGGKGRAGEGPHDPLAWGPPMS